MNQPDLDLVQTRPSSGLYLWVVDDGAAAAHPLASGLVALCRLTRGTAESVGLMPAEQSLTLQDRPDQNIDQISPIKSFS